MSQNNIPVSETYWSLVDKADKKFSKIRDLPYYERNRYDTYFYKVFKVYTQLWKFQQENRQKLLEAGLKRWEIGDIASRIGQLYFGQYMRTSDASYLSESYVFYEAVLTREYFKDGLLQDLNLANKQLRFLARFMMVCLVLNRREMVYQLVNQLKMLVDECKRTFQETDFKEWKLVVQEIVKFLKADTAFMNIIPLRYSLVLDLHPESLPQVAAARRKLRLKDAILSSYYHNEVKYSELTLDTFRMLQCLEWEPSGSFYQSGGVPSSGTGTNTAQNGAPGPSRINHSQDIADPTLPPNPRKAVLYRPTVTQFVAVLATMCEELPPDGLLLIYLSASGSNISGSPHNSQGQGKGDSLSYRTGGLHIGARGNGGVDSIYPCDFVPFTRKPLFIVVDSDNSKAFKAINGVEKGEPAAMLLSPTSYPTVPSNVDSSRHPSGSLFTSFLTAPLQGFCLLLGITGSDIDTDMFNKARGLLSSLLNDWGSMLAASDTLDPVWAQGLSDPFLRRLLLRFIFCRAVLTLYTPASNKEEYLPECIPGLPDAFLPMAATSQTAVLQIANIFGATNRFVFSEGINRNRILLDEAQAIWEVDKLFGISYDGDENEVISKIAEMEALNKAWVREMASLVKSIDRNHLLEVGLEGFYGQTTPQRKSLNPGFDIGTDFIANNRIPGIDFATVHSYPDQWLSSSNDQNQLSFLDNWLNAHIQDSQYLIRKPLLITEFGRSWKDPGFSTYQRDLLFNSVYTKIYSSVKRGGPAAGGLFWQLLSEGMESSFGDGYEIVLSQSSSTANVISQQCHKLYQIRKIFARLRNIERWKRAQWSARNRGKRIGH